MKKQLIKVFKNTFPSNTDESVQTLSEDTCQEWDSISVVHLIVGIEQEFKITVDLEELSKFTSFENVHSYLEGKI